MRISNINQYLGGANNVIAREIIEQDSIGFLVRIQGKNLDNYSFDVNTELFQATLSARGSNVTIQSFQKATEASIRTLTGDTSATLNSNGNFNYPNAITRVDGTTDQIRLVLPSTLLSDLTSAHAPAPNPTNNDNPFVVAVSVSLSTPNIAPVTAWAASTAYTANQQVKNDNKIWAAKAAFTSGATFNSNNWNEVPIITESFRMLAIIRYRPFND